MNIIKKAKQFLFSSAKTVLIVALCLAFVATVFCTTSIVRERETEATFTHRVQSTEVVAVGYLIKDGLYLPSSDDPQIYIPGAGAAINDVSICLSEPLDSSLLCKLYYATNNEGLCEDRSVSQIVKKGQTEIFFTLPSGVYTTLRVDIDGSFEVSEVVLSEMQQVQEYNALYVDWTALVVRFAVLSLLIGAAFVYRKQLSAAIRFTKTKFFSEDTLDLCACRKQDKKLANAFVVISAITCFLLIFIIPPLTVADEIAHFLNVLKVSHLDFFPVVKDGVMGMYLSTDEIAFVTAYSDVHHAFMDIHSIAGTSPAYAYAVNFYANNVLHLNPFGYILPGLGVALIKVVIPGISVYSQFLFARSINAIFYIAVTYWAIRATPVFKKTMFLLALMPMTLHQCASTSYDAILIPASFLLFAYAAKILLEKDTYRIGLLDMFAICLASGVLFSTKYVYIVLLLIMLSVSIKKFGSFKRYLVCIGMIGAIGVIFYLIPSMVTSSILADIPEDEMKTAYAAYFRQNPFIIKEILHDTVMRFYKLWSVEFIGVFGWLNLFMPKFFCFVYGAVMSLVFVSEAVQIKGISFATRILSLAGCTVFFVGSVMALYLRHTAELGVPVGGTISYGFQGRYFIPAAMFFCIVFSNPLLARFKYLKQINRASEKIALATSVAFSLLTVFILISGYWL